ncbi:MAG: DNA repair protein RecN [Hyphomonas sp.]|uniref:DNA repair protein RecN n=1 Tax=Hyphomonas sp. TaxID=87 RepID=UPI00184BB135|nr:DNA repair protein RecN [Hyphomonas sp.]MBA3068429.1 DNA repair protein RecN [Hyphomonas sp.]MBU3920484.1 DNA repair protein RecN [Alphaproteobacteria bacterium]MBU4060703.1 DNA repair protein RecN [Alphaproteobacteria bacterium]MBU4164687.1 DNA repair protein RecN [Alphaproteobacteria bacterium]
MMLALSIRDFVLISRLDVSPGEGFTALTGETGAGKSIILDALSLALGGAADRSVIRHGAAQASVAAEFAPAPDHPVWALLSGQGVEASPGEALTLKRLVRAEGPARAFINDQPVGAALLAEAGDLLVEVHGQHAASSLLRPAVHRRLLDQFAGNEALLAACAATHAARVEARSAREAIEAAAQSASEERTWLQETVGELAKLAPQVGEATRLAEMRAQLMQSERVLEAVAEATAALEEADAEAALAKASRAAERICRLPGFDGTSGPLPEAARAACEAIERAMIELREAETAIAALERLPVDSGDLEGVEGRLFALRALGRKLGCEADLLPARWEDLAARLELAEAGEAGLGAARKAERAAEARWHSAAHALGEARRAAASRLEAAIAAELAPLKLGRATIRVAFTPLAPDEAGAAGAERAEFEAETNAGAGFGPLRKVASGGELARVSLAVKCALAEAGSAATLIFDEADQGVGGAVAAAIGERLVRLSATRQVLAVTHSPQVAAAADAHWLVEKAGKAGGTRLTTLDAGTRQEEIARMLSGAEITDEARAAAGRLLEDA